MRKERIINLPNILSGYRVIIFPFILFLIYTGKQNLFLLFFCINLVTDILDGAIARRFDLKTQFGARLDSIGDFSSYIAAGYGIVQFKWSEISNNGLWLLFFLIAFLLPYVVSYLKFGKFPSLHLYSCKIGGALDGIFFFCLFFSGYNEWLFMLAIFWGMVSFMEMTIILLLLKDLRPDCKGLYWILKP